MAWIHLPMESRILENFYPKIVGPSYLRMELLICYLQDNILVIMVLHMLQPSVAVIIGELLTDGLRYL